MKGRHGDKLSPIEQEIVAAIRALRVSREGPLYSALVEKPTALARHFILSVHGNVQLRVSILSAELGVEMRTLERAFVAEYQKTMSEFESEIRLAYARQLLCVSPPTKISAVAAMLGYDVVHGFNRFFKKNMHQSPSEWGRIERARIERAARRQARD